MALMGHELPEYYQPGASLSLNLEPTNTSLSLWVLRAVTPFTTGQAILVELDPGKDSATYLHLPKTLMLKVYDTKFFSHRIPPWTLEAETIATAGRKEPNRSPDPDFEPWKQPEEDDAPGWEEWYYQVAELRYHAEVSAYDCLKVFQGTTLAHCYSTGLLQLPERAIAPRAILFEFIPDAKRLDQVDPKVVSANLLHSILETTEQFGRLGVVHTDIKPSNVIFSPGDQPVQAVIIDFEEAGIREDESDVEWHEVVDMYQDPVWMRKRFKRCLGDVYDVFVNYKKVESLAMYHMLNAK